MSDLTTAAIIVGSVLTYAAMTGVGWQLAGAHWRDPGPFFVGLLWPIVLPALAGAVAARRIATRQASLPKAQVRQ